MGGWNFDMSAAPKGEHRQVPIGSKGGTRSIHVPTRIIAAAADGKTVTISGWVDDQNRWNMFTQDAPPIAWMPWPDHPEAA